ncbi:MAG TPA: hypothetical protein DCL86_11400 [Bacteroidales bacterium]|nr:hypothetical protein [Bacteroidales bacterium]
MKKKLLVTAVIWLGVASFAFAQVEKGNWFLGGSSNLEFNSDKEKVKIDNTTNDRATYLDFDFRPQIGYFVIDKLPVGIAMDISLDKTKDEINDWEHTWNDFIIGPFVRYYITDLDGFITKGFKTRGHYQEYCYLIRSNKAIAVFSSMYYANYNEMRAEIQKHLEHLG